MDLYRGRRCVVPNVRGLTLIQAKTRIKRARRRLGTLSKVRSTKVERGRVLRQTPSRGDAYGSVGASTSYSAAVAESSSRAQLRAGQAPLRGAEKQRN